jgi:hypothetical protein
VTALQYSASALNDEYDDNGDLAYHNPTLPAPLPYTPNNEPQLYTDLNHLHRDFENRIPDAITYMHNLMDYSDECEREEWERVEQETTGYTQAHTHPPSTEPPPPTMLHNPNTAYPTLPTYLAYLEDESDSNTYDEEFGMDTNIYEPWEFGDRPSKAPHYWNEPDLL